MSDPVITFDGIWKKFARGEQHTSLRDFIPAMASKLLPWKRKPKSAVAELHGQEFWAVKDVSFQLKRGESLGIIGPNGSGKSTTLKLLSGILRPDRGRYSVKGRLSALIEVGAGFHPDLTGRENVYLNGCILGMTRKELNAKFNDIVEFAGVEEFIDTPVKRYSSGMAVRLGFAVAALVEPEVLLVDEVLAVGDMEFRNRCHARMDRMKKNGVTMILVSHNLSEVRNLCEQTISLFKGEKVMQGPTGKVLEQYYQTISAKIRVEQDKDPANKRKDNSNAPVRLLEAQFLNHEGRVSEVYNTGRPLTIRIFYDAPQRIESPQFKCDMFWSGDDFLATTFNTTHKKFDAIGPIEGRGYVDLNIKSMLVEPNVFGMRISVGDGKGATWDSIPRVRFVISEEIPVPGVFALEHEWSVTPGGVPDRAPIVINTADAAPSESTAIAPPQVSLPASAPEGAAA